jgi:hypothetical protein
MNDIAPRILRHCDIDTRLALSVPPGRVDTSGVPVWRPHDGIVYRSESGTLFNFHQPGFHTRCHPVALDIECDGLLIFNLYGQPYTCDTFADTGGVTCTPTRATWATDLKVLIT